MTSARVATAFAAVGFVIAALMATVWILLSERDGTSSGSDGEAAGVSQAAFAEGDLSARLGVLEQQLDRVIARLDGLVEAQTDLATQQQEINDDLQSLKTRIGQRMPEPDGTPPSERYDSLDAPFTDEIEDAQIDQQMEQQIEQDMRVLSYQLSAEKIDAGWSAVATDLIRGIAEKPELAGTTFTRVDCRTTMCEIEGSHENREAMDALTHSLLLELKWNSTMALRVTEQGNGRVSSTIFLSRDGYDLEY